LNKYSDPEETEFNFGYFDEIGLSIFFYGGILDFFDEIFMKWDADC